MQSFPVSNSELGYNSLKFKIFANYLYYGILFAMGMRTSQIQTQKQVLAPSMQQSIEVLLLPITELNAAIDQELQENPLLEIDEALTAQQNKQVDDIIRYSLKNYGDRHYSPGGSGNSDDEQIEDRPIACSMSLDESLLRQLHLEITDEAELQIGELIIGNLDHNGYLKISCEEIAHWFKLEDTYPVEMILRIVQSFEPIGIASRNLKECLLIQIRLNLNGTGGLATKIVRDYLDELGRKRYIDIARKMKISVDEVRAAAKLISNLEPKPSRKYQQNSNTNIYIKPDITIVKDENDEYNVSISNENIPYLRISQTYQKILKQPNRPKEETEFIREKIKNALLFMKSIEQRQHTLKNIAEYILQYQKEFFDSGNHNVLKPLILKDVALVVDRNESTVCRAISNKYMDTPVGLFPIKFFFSQAVNENQKGESVSSRSIKEELKCLIEHENKAKPLSDSEIERYFTNKGMKIARRTISKYRQKLNILPSHLRKT